MKRFLNRISISLVMILTMVAFSVSTAWGQRKEGKGPYKKLVIRGATMIYGNGTPPLGPIDITIKGDKIVRVQKSGTPAAGHLIMKDKNVLKGATRVIDARGMYVTPGFIDLHNHPGNLEYRYKLDLGHGITTARFLAMGSLKNMDHLLEQRKLSKENKIVAPRLRVCAGIGAGKQAVSIRSRFRAAESRSAMEGKPLKKISTPEKARAYVRWAKKKGIDCIGEEEPKENPAVIQAYLAEADSLGMTSMIHIGYENPWTARDFVKWGADEIEHYYGIFKSILKDHSLRNFPPDYNDFIDKYRYFRIGWLTNQSYPPESEPWNNLIAFFKKHRTILDPTFNIYQSNYQYMKARNADWMPEYALPKLWESFLPNAYTHSALVYRETSVQETKVRRFFNKWRRFVYDYNLAGGRVTLGTDSNNGFQLDGFDYIEEMIDFEYAGFTPLEVIRSATLYGAQAIFRPFSPHGHKIKYGVLRPGLKADILVMTKNPLEDFKTLYGTGALRLDKKTGKLKRVRSLKYTIKDGIVYDSQKLLKDVRQMVKKAKQKTGIEVKIPVLIPSKSNNIHYNN